MESNWINDLRKRFLDRRLPAPDGLFDEINSNLSKKKVPQHKARVLPLWIRATISVAALIAVVLLIGLLWQINQKKDESISQASPKKMEKPQVKQTLQESLSITEDEPQIEPFFKVKQKGVTYLKEEEKEPFFKEEENDVLLSEDITTKKENLSQDESKNTPPKAKENSSYVYHDRGYFEKDDNNFLTKNSSKKKKEAPKINLYASNLTFSGANSSFNTVNYAQPLMISNHETEDEIMLLSTSDTRDSDEPEVNVHHRFPLKIGASVRFNLVKRLGLEIGLFYTHHQSDIMSGDEDGGYKTVRKLDYLGIPLYLDYDIYSSRYLTVYAKAGATAEFCVWGKSTTDYIVVNTVTETTQESVRDKNPQWSVSLMPGIQYNFNSYIGLYAEPGIAYYFDNHSGMNTIYKDKKVNFNLNVGLRLSLFDK